MVPKQFHWLILGSHICRIVVGCNPTHVDEPPPVVIFHEVVSDIDVLASRRTTVFGNAHCSFVVAVDQAIALRETQFLTKHAQLSQLLATFGEGHVLGFASTGTH